MRILVFSPTTIRIGAGAEQNLLTVCHLLRKEGHSVHLAFLDWHGKAEEWLSPEQLDEGLGGVQYTLLPSLVSSGANVPFPSVRGLVRLSRLIHWSDVVVANQYYGTDIAVLLLARFHRKPIVMQAAVMLHSLRTSPSDLLQDGYERVVGRRVLRKCHLVRVSTKFMRESLLASGVRNVLTLPPPGPDEDLVQNARSLGKADRSPSPKVADAPFRILVAGRDSFQKGYDVAAATLRQLAEVDPEHLSLYRFVLVGPSELPTEIASLSPKLRALVSNVGPVSRKKVLEILGGADVLLAPSRYESFGMVVMEGMAMGRIVIASSIPSFDEILDGGRAGFLVPREDARGFAERIVGCRQMRDEHPSEWEELSRRARARYDREYSAKEYASRIQEFSKRLGQLAGSSFQPAPEAASPPPRILIFSPSDIHLARGNEIDLLSLARALHRRRCSIALAYCRFPWLLHGRRPSDSALSSELGTPVVEIPMLRIGGLAFPLMTPGGVLRLLRALREYDLVLASQYYGNDVLVHLLCELRGLPLVTSQANAYLHPHLNPSETLQDLYNRTLGSLLLARSAGVRVWNMDDQRSVIQLGQPEAFLLYPQGVDGGTNEQGREEGPRAGLPPTLRPAEEGTFEVLVAGRMSAQKGMDVIEGMLERMLKNKSLLKQEYRFYFAGTARLPPKIEDFTQRCPNAVINLGPLSRASLTRVMRAVDVLLMPSHYESFGMVAMEAQSQGTHVLCSRITGLKDIVIDGRNGRMVQGWDAESYVSALKGLRDEKARDPKDWDASRQRTVEDYRARFGPETYERRVDEFLVWLTELARKSRTTN